MAGIETALLGTFAGAPAAGTAAGTTAAAGTAAAGTAGGLSAGTLATIAGVTGATSAILEGMAEKAQEKTARQAHRVSAAVYKQEAQIAKEAALQEAADRQRRLRSLLSEQRAAYGQSGVGLWGATPLMTQLETLQEYSKDINRVLASGLTRSTQARTASALERLYALSAGRRGSMAQMASLFSAGGDILRGVSQSRYYRDSLLSGRAGAKE